MAEKKYYAGIDRFRMIAALLVVAIHTSPLVSFSERGDFIFTRVIARVAVPFFFMSSGFFLISRYAENTGRLLRFEKKTAVIYAVSTLIYIPVNIYKGYFAADNLLPEIIKDIVFDGTLYHLWYLPASMIGAGIAWYLVRKLDYKKAMAAAAALYLVGVFGDSYLGIAKQAPVLNGFYQLVFQVCDYTRNGIFFAPVFLILGRWIAGSRRMLSHKKSVFGFFISLAFMLAEAGILHRFQVQHHDSMYLFLLPCMYFLFSVLLHWKGKRIGNLRLVSLVIYIIHPMMILAVRLSAKAIHLQTLFVENSLMHYLLVCLSSAVAAVVFVYLWEKFRIKKAKTIAGSERSYLEIDLDHLGHNVKELRKLMPPKCELMAVVKAEAYGHGLFAISTHLDKIGVKAFAVATVDEGIRLRKYGIRGEILILGYTDVQRASELKKYRLMQTVIDYGYALALNRQRIPVKVHIKIDTGMHRLGIDSADFLKVRKVFAMRNLKVCGMYTHLCCADSLQPEDVSFANEQIDRFYALVHGLESSGIHIPKLHIQSSYGLLNYPDLECDYARIGIALYGTLSSQKDHTQNKPDLRPVLSLKSKVALIREVSKGGSIGYGRAFTAERDSRVAIVPVGYGDGFSRNLSCGNSSVSVNRRRVPVIGMVCMDQLAIDITDAGDVAVGDTVTLIGAERCGEPSAPETAGGMGSISNELLCRMGARLPVIVK